MYKYSAGQLRLKISVSEKKILELTRARDELMRSRDKPDWSDRKFRKEYGRLSQAISIERRNIGWYHSLLAEHL